MGVGDAHQLEQALHAAVLAPAAVQGIEADLGFQLGQALGKIATGVDARDLVAGALQRLRRRPAPELRLTLRSADRPPSRTAT